MNNYTTPVSSRQEENNYKYISAVEQGGRVMDVVKTSFTPACHIKRISKELYLKGTYDKEGNFITTGEVYEVARKEEPMRNRRSLKRIFKELRQLITHNYKGGKSELFVTLTYAEQTNDHKQVHADFKNFWKRLKRSFKEIDMSYISIVEPHGSGMFHIHLLLRANNTEYLYIDNRIMQDLWGLGFTQTERLEDVDNVGAYFIAYFSNLEIPPEKEAEYALYGDIEEKNGKKYIKGKRLDFYPDGMQIHRHSRDIAKPEKLTGQAAENAILINGVKPKFSHTKTIEMADKFGKVREAEVTTEQYEITKGDKPW